MKQETFNKLVCFYWEHNWKELSKEELDLQIKGNTPLFSGHNDKDVANIKSYVEQNGPDGILSNIYHVDVESLKSTPKGQLVLEFYYRLPEWFVYDLSNCEVCYGLKDDNKKAIKDNFNISRDDFLLFQRDTSFFAKNQGLVITDNAFHIIPDNDQKNKKTVIEWQAIERVGYKETIFYFHLHNGKEEQLPYTYFFKSSSPDTDRCKKLAQVLTDLANLIAVVPEPWELYQEGKVEEALDACNVLISSDDIAKQVKGYFNKGRVIYEMERSKGNIEGIGNKLAEAKKDLTEAYNLSKDTNTKAAVQFLLGSVKSLLGDVTARNNFILGMESNDKDIKEKSYHELQALEDKDKVKDYWNNYVTERSYKERKFIMPIMDKDIAGCVTDGITIFRMSNIPSCIKFTMGHPIANQLYIGHPFNPSLYMPFDESDDLFFVDKIHELCFLLECLGAEEITITSIKGKSIEEMKNSSTDIKGNAEIKKVKADGHVNIDGSSNNQSNMKTQRTQKLVFDPTKKPYVPKGLVWYEEQPQWKRLAQSRVQGNLLEYSENVSSSSTEFMSNTEKLDITANAEYIWGKVHIDAKKEAQKQLKDTVDTQWKVEVRFRSTELLKDDSEPGIEDPKQQKQSTNESINNNEEKYLNEVKFCLEDDGQIDSTERRFLNRIRDSYGITPERAAEIEKMVTAKLTDGEKEYIDAVKDILADGEISPRASKMLERLRISYGISEERATELKKIIR